MASAQILLTDFLLGMVANITFTLGIMADDSNKDGNNNSNNCIGRCNLRFVTISSLCRELYAQVAWVQSYANHVQHIGRSSRVTCRVPRGMKEQLNY